MSNYNESFALKTESINEQQQDSRKIVECISFLRDPDSYNKKQADV